MIKKWLKIIDSSIRKIYFIFIRTIKTFLVSILKYKNFNRQKYIFYKIFKYNWILNEEKKLKKKMYLGEVDLMKFYRVFKNSNFISFVLEKFII